MAIPSGAAMNEWRRRATAVLSVVVMLVMQGCAARSGRDGHAVVLEPGGCRLEAITDAGLDDGHFQFHGPSADNGQLLVGWYRGTETGAYVLDLRTGARRPLAGFNNAGVFSPDGKRVLAANRLANGNRELVEYNLATSETDTVAPHPSADFLATYSRDGREILFNSYRTGQSDVYVISAHRGTPRRLTTFDGYDAHADWSPDERSVLFHREVTKGDYDIIVLDLTSGQERPLIAGPGEQAYPAWSPDGRFIAFASDSAGGAGKLDLYLTDRNRSRTVRLTAHPGYNTYPAWSRDGTSLYFNGERNGKRNVFRLDFRKPMQCDR